MIFRRKRSFFFNFNFQKNVEKNDWLSRGDVKKNTPYLFMLLSEFLFKNASKSASRETNTAHISSRGAFSSIPVHPHFSPSFVFASLSHDAHGRSGAG